MVRFVMLPLLGWMGLIGCIAELPALPEVVQVCGDRQVEGNETCDDGNLLSYDGCTQLCELARCGDGFQRLDLGPEDEGYERCDDGNARNDDDCLETCVPARCGDGFVRLGIEGCDLGDEGNGDAASCTTNCVPARCGDGLLYAGVEACDDANTDPTDNCVNCQRPSCGDGFVWFGEEACDDGNDDDTDACTTACEVARCGDGILRADSGFEETCDDGNSHGWDDCTNACEPPSCGDGVVRLNVTFESPEFEECEPGEGAVCGEDCRWNFRFVANTNMVRNAGERADYHMLREVMCYRHPNGQVWCWGRNVYGQLGNDPDPDGAAWVVMGSPVQVVTENGQPLSNVRDLAVSSDHGCAVTNDERIYCWGTWSFGQRGLTPVQGELPPGYATEFPHSVVRPIRAIAASTFRISGQGTSCIIDGNYDTKCWGVLVRPYPDWPGINLAPLPPGIPATTSPALVSGMGNAHRLALSRDDLCVRLQTGALRCRGVNLKGALGRAGTERTGNAQFAITQTVTTWGNPVDVLSHDAFVGCTRQTDASVRCAGSRWGGLLGNDYMPNHSGEPVQPIGLDPVRQVSVGHRHVCVLQADGRLKCWGNNDYGVMGLGHRNGSGDCWANSSGSNENVREEDDEQFYFAGVKCFQVPQEGSIQENTVYLTSGMASLCGVTGSGRIWCRGVVTSDGGNSEPRFEFDKWVNIPAP